MPHCTENTGATRRTSIGLAAMQADALHRILLSSRGTAPTLEAIQTLPDLHGWHRRALERAIDQLVADGVLTENASGHLIVAPAYGSGGHVTANSHPGDVSELSARGRRDSVGAS